MKLSARNILQGKVLRITEGAVNSEVVLEIAPGIEVVSIITRTSADRLGIAVGKAAYAIIKASDVMLGAD